MYITPSMTARISVRRLPPPRLAGGISGSTHAPSSSVRVARISQVIAVVLRPVLVRPQCKPLLESGWAPSNPSDSKESRSLRTDTQTWNALIEDERTKVIIQPLVGFFDLGELE